MSIMVKAEEIGYVDTVLSFLVPIIKLSLKLFDDPEVQKCHLLFKPC